MSEIAGEDRERGLAALRHIRSQIRAAPPVAEGRSRPVVDEMDVADWSAERVAYEMELAAHRDTLQRQLVEKDEEIARLRGEVAQLRARLAELVARAADALAGPPPGTGASE